MINLLLRQEIEHTFQTVKTRCTSDELVFLCPQPGCGDSTGNRSVNMKTGLTSCWRCNVGGPFIRWAATLGFRFDHENTTMLLSPAELLEQQQNQNRKTYVPVMNDVKLPADFTRIADEPESVYTRLITKMAVRKNLAYEDMVEAGAGFTRGDAYWEPFTLFPVYEYGRVVYFQGRTYRDVPGEPTKRFPSRQHVKYGSRYWIYNIDELWKTRAHTVIIVESILNVLSLRWKLRKLGLDGIVPICVFKHAVSTFQIYKLMRYTEHLKELCLMFDHDALKQSWKDSERLTGQFNVTVAEMPAGPDNQKLDPNDDVETAMGAFENRSVFRKNHSVMFVARQQLDKINGRNARDCTTLPVLGT